MLTQSKEPSIQAYFLLHILPSQLLESQDEQIRDSKPRKSNYCIQKPFRHIPTRNEQEIYHT